MWVKIVFLSNRIKMIWDISLASKGRFNDGSQISDNEPRVNIFLGIIYGHQNFALDWKMGYILVLLLFYDVNRKDSSELIFYV